MASFDAALKRLLDDEGGYSNDPVDRGGETIFGISRVNWPEWPGWKVVEVLKTTEHLRRHFSPEGDLLLAVQEFYRTNFWQPIHGDEIASDKVAMILFSIAVNAGMRTAVRFLQDALNALNSAGLVADGAMGQKTLAALHKYTNQVYPLSWYLLSMWTNLHAEIIRRQPNQSGFAVGWVRRAMRLWEA